ncbi:MAG: hypothetical protein QOH31_4292, partial [Verrucomicrobiota bacterium]
MNAQSFAALREGCNEVSQRNLTKVAQHEVLGLASLKSHPSRTGRSTNAGIPEWRARPKAKRFYRPGWDGRVFLLHFPALRTGLLLSPSPSGTSPHRAILSTYVDAHGLLPDAPSDRWSLDEKEYFIIHSAVQILLNIHSFWPFPTCEFIGGIISL